LRQLAARAENAREVERTRIARQIHDELAQQLTGLKMDLAWANKRLPADQGPVRDKLARMAELIDSTIQSVRRITADLRPGLLDDFGLPAVLEWQLEDFEMRTGIGTHLTLAVDDLPLATEQTTSLFRIVQEALANVERHAQATTVEVRLERLADRLVMSVADDGRGMDAARPSGARALGLLGMRERVRALGGVLDLYSRPGEGTTVHVQIPLADKN
jgi:signal transduction histidine kinase